MRLLSTHAIEIWRYDKDNPQCAPATYISGEYVPSIKARLVTSGTLYPVSNGVKINVSEDITYTTDMNVLLTKEPVYCQDNMTNREADIVTVNGLPYEVVAVEDWRILSMTSHFRSYVKRRIDLDGEYCNDKC